MAIGVLAVSTSGPLMAAIAAPALAVALWRNVLAVAVIAPAALTDPAPELRAPDPAASCAGRPAPG